MPGIFVQASAEPNDCVKPNEQNRVYSNFAMASNRTFKNLFGLCRAQPKISKKRHYAEGQVSSHAQRYKNSALFHQSQTNVIAFFLSAQSVILPFAIFTLLLFRKF